MFIIRIYVIIREKLKVLSELKLIYGISNSTEI